MLCAQGGSPGSTWSLTFARENRTNKFNSKVEGSESLCHALPGNPVRFVLKVAQTSCSGTCPLFLCSVLPHLCPLFPLFWQSCLPCGRQSFCFCSASMHLVCTLALFARSFLSLFSFAHCLPQHCCGKQLGAKLSVRVCGLFPFIPRLCPTLTHQLCHV